MKTFQTACLLAGLLAAGSACAQATIDHNKALAGNITPGDTPGYPITLSQPGHYRLMGNLSVPEYTAGIEITAHNVTLDLNGFTVSGPAKCTQHPDKTVTCSPSASETASGVRSMPSAPAFVLRNGRVTGFQGAGIQLGASAHVEGVHSRQNNAGIVAGDGVQRAVQIRNSSSELNRTLGIYVPYGSVQNTTAAANGQLGIAGAGGLVVQDSLVLHNAGSGLINLVARGTLSRHNVSNRTAVTSMGGNVDGNTVY